MRLLGPHPTFLLPPLPSHTVQLQILMDGYPFQTPCLQRSLDMCNRENTAMWNDGLWSLHLHFRKLFFSSVYM